jgi:hypothetical protein
MIPGLSFFGSGQPHLLSPSRQYHLLNPHSSVEGRLDERGIQLSTTRRTQSREVGNGSAAAFATQSPAVFFRGQGLVSGAGRAVLPSAKVLFVMQI